MAVTAPARLGLGTFPTPLTEVPRLAAALRIAGPLFVKRDDLTGFAFGGNKVRALEFLLADALATGCDTLVTGGAPGSNFIASAAAGAAFVELGNHVVLAGTPVPAGSHPNLAAALRWGAQPHWTGTTDRSQIERHQPEVARGLSEGGYRPYVVPRGGATATGSLGYRFAVDELCEQLPAGTTPTLVVATGSGGTLAGIVAGLVARGRPFPVVGVSVSRAPDEVAARVLDLATEVAGRRGEPLPGPEDVRLVDGRGPGHGTPSLPGRWAAKVALVAAGLVLDPVYTAKALAAVPDLAPEGPVLFWHTGGLPDAVDDLVRETE